MLAKEYCDKAPYKKNTKSQQEAWEQELFIEEEVTDRKDYSNYF